EFSMQSHYICLLFCLLIGLVSPIAGQTTQRQEGTAEAKPHHTIVPLSQNGKMRVRDFDIPFELVSGHPDIPGAPFVIRMLNDENQVVAPHWHPCDENMVIIK